MFSPGPEPSHRFEFDLGGFPYSDGTAHPHWPGTADPPLHWLVRQGVCGNPPIWVTAPAVARWEGRRLADVPSRQAERARKRSDSAARGQLAGRLQGKGESPRRRPPLVCPPRPTSKRRGRRSQTRHRHGLRVLMAGPGPSPLLLPHAMGRGREGSVGGPPPMSPVKRSSPQRRPSSRDLLLYAASSFHTRWDQLEPPTRGGRRLRALRPRR